MEIRFLGCRGTAGPRRRYPWDRFVRVEPLRICGLACACGAVDEGAGPAGGDGAVAGEPGGFGVGLEEGAVGHDELDLDAADPAGGAGGAFDEGVGHGLAAGAGVPVGAEGVGVPGQGVVDGDALGDGQQRAQEAMVSGAGRRLTCRSVAACAARSVTERGSSR